MEIVNMIKVYEKLSIQLINQGLKFRAISSQHAKDLQNEIEAEHAQGLLAEEFYQERLKFYQFDLPEGFSSDESLIVVAIPRPQTPVNFTWNGKKRCLILPPTYAKYIEINRQIGGLLSEVLAPEGYRVAQALLPLKLLAVRSGLAEYGRNNIGYISGMGSFFQLAAYYSDMPCQEDPWQEPVMMERCKTCHACMSKCPTGAIAPDRFLLHADRCLVFHNERSASHQFPTWIEPGMHHCLMGCMVCQQYCPEDKPFLAWFEQSVDFSSKETDLLLKGSNRSELPADTTEKLKALELIDSLELLPRNLGVFLKKSGPTTHR
jgi:epoxyqueuosine reductase